MNARTSLLAAALATGVFSQGLAGEKEPEAARPAGSVLQRALQGPLSDIDQLVFAVRPPARHHYYENFGFYLYPRAEYPLPQPTTSSPGPPLFEKGGRLVKLHLKTGEVAVLLDDPAGGVRDPQVHHSGRKIVFSYRPGGQPYYHLFEIGADGSGLKQLTDGPFDDIEPAYVPDGGVVFCSSRCRRFVGCNPSPVATLYRCQSDGSEIRELSPSPFTDNTPWVLPDGRVLFTRWEYVDRNQMSFHHLWTTNPDGTGQMVYFGNQYQGRNPPPPRFTDVAMLDAKPIPGTGKVVASFSPGHGRWEHLGRVTIVDPSLGPDCLDSARALDPKRMFRDPYPLSEDCFLVADGQGLWVMNGRGETELVYSLPPGDKPLECHEPRPLARRRRERTVPSRVDLSQKTGRLVLQDILQGRNMAGVSPGEITQLLVLEQLPKPLNFSGGQEPLTIGGTFALERILGTVPVESDGSAFFEVPAGRPLFLVALDKHGLSVKRMQSFLTVQPGETTGCVGCHEQRLLAPPSMPLLDAAGREPSRIEAVAGVPDVIDYPRDIQPILDRHCVECHKPDRRDGNVELTGDRTPIYSVSYWTMITRGLISDPRNYLGNQPPRAVGSSASRLLELADGSHYDAAPSPQERTLLRLWIETGATYPGTYAALGCGIATVDFPSETIKRHCGACHIRENVKPYAGRSKGDLFQFGDWEPPQALVSSFRDFNIVIRLAYLKFGEAPPHQSLCNLTRPDQSLLLRAPLARGADGLQRCSRAVFSDVGDTDYRRILGAIDEAARRLQRQKRFDMPGFRPSPYYIGQMQNYGVLPKDLPPDRPIDPYAVDQAYWRSLWVDPPGAACD